jgi:hypothetical protein
VAEAGGVDVTAARNPRAEATALLPDGYEARVLEPSPPTNTDPNWFADDPTDPSSASHAVVTPIDGEGTTWSALLKDHPHLTGYATDHWLGNLRRLRPLPEGFRNTRLALHQLAYFVLAPKRFRETGKLGLRYTHRGFGTPFFGDDEQVRIEGDRIIRQQGARAHASLITTVSSAADFVGIPYEERWYEGFRDPLDPTNPEKEVTIGSAAAEALGDLFGFAASVLEQARRTSGAVDVSRVQLWPEHFDLAFEMGSGDQRASYGVSPGDGSHDEPYVYVAAWGPISRSDLYWNDTSFNGARLSYSDLLNASDQRTAALDFLDAGYERLTR